MCLTDLGFEPEKNNFESVISPEVTQCGSVAGRYNPVTNKLTNIAMSPCLPPSDPSRHNVPQSASLLQERLSLSNTSRRHDPLCLSGPLRHHDSFCLTHYV